MIVCSAWADLLPSLVVTVHPSTDDVTREVVAAMIGSTAMTIPARNTVWSDGTYVL